MPFLLFPAVISYHNMNFYFVVISKSKTIFNILFRRFDILFHNSYYDMKLFVVAVEFVVAYIFVYYVCIYIVFLYTNIRF